VLPDGAALRVDGVPTRLPFRPRAFHSGAGDKVWMGVSGDPEIFPVAANRSEPASGQITLPVTPARVTRQDVADWKAFDLSQTVREDRARVDRNHGRIDFPRTLPLYQSIDVDAAMRVWVMGYEFPWSTKAYTWHVFDQDGSKVADARAPFDVLSGHGRSPGVPGLLTPILAIGADYILVLRRDPEYGVEQVHMHRIIRQ
jgi:hypothetical protein